MSRRRDYYRILHVQRDAPAEVIRSSYRTMMQKLKMHPDLGGDHEDAALINEAFSMLSNADTRAEYDASIAPDNEPAAPAEGAQSHRARSNRTAEEDTEPDSDDLVESTQSDPDSTPVDGDDHCQFCSAHCRPLQYREPDDVCSGCGGPLFPAEQRRFEIDSQRAMERISKQTSVLFSLRSMRHSPQTGIVQDISLNGMQFQTGTELATGQILLVRTSVLDAIARVVDSRRSSADAKAPWRVGLLFLTIRFHRTLGSFVSVDV